MKVPEIKTLLGNIPFTAELYWYLRQGGKPPVGGYSLDRLKQAIPGWVSQASGLGVNHKTGKSRTERQTDQ